MNEQEISVAEGIIFLGACERAAYVREGRTNLFKWNVLGLKHVVLSHIFPIPLSGISLGFAFNPSRSPIEYQLRIAGPDGNDVGRIGLATVPVPREGLETPTQSTSSFHFPAYGWSTVFFPLDEKIVAQKPGVYSIHLDSLAGTQEVGRLEFALIDPPPLTEDRIAAIRSDPTSAKAVRLEFGCRFCESKYRIYAGLNQDSKQEAEGWLWYRDIGDEFACGCGKTQMDLRIARRNLHGLLGQQQNRNVEFVPLYERSSLEHIRGGLIKLIDSATREEQLQQFFADNPVLLHQFPAERLFPKPPILTFFFADFAVITPRRELVLIELEKPSTRLLKKDGGIAAELSHAFDQVRDWLHTVDEHRVAVLDSLKIERDQVSSVRGVVIAGRDAGYNETHLRKLKGAHSGRITFMTYDDIALALTFLIKKITGL